MLSPSAILDARLPQSGLTSARQHQSAINVLHLKCFEAVTAIMTGRNVNGVHEIKLNTAYVPVSENDGITRFNKIRHP